MRPVDELRAQLVEVTSGVTQAEIVPERIEFTSIEPGPNQARQLAISGDFDSPLRLEGEGLALFRDKLQLTATTVRDLRAQEAVWLFNNRRSELSPVVVDVKGDIIIGEHEGLLDPVASLDACLQGIGECEVLVGSEHMRPNYLSCDMMLPVSVDPMNVGDPSHAACHFTTNGETRIDLRIYRLACTNGMTVDKEVFREVMAHKDHEQRLLETTIAAEKCLHAAEAIVHEYALLAEYEVESVDDAIAQWCRTHNISREVAEAVCEIYHEYYEDMGSNAYAITQAFTYAASHPIGDSALSPGQRNKINKMLTSLMRQNSDRHCTHCGANLLQW